MIPALMQHWCFGGNFDVVLQYNVCVLCFSTSRVPTNNYKSINKRHANKHSRYTRCFTTLLPTCSNYTKLSNTSSGKCFITCSSLGPKVHSRTLHNSKNTNMFGTLKSWHFQKKTDSRIWKFNMFQGWPHSFSYIRWIILVINTGSDGPDLVDFWAIQKCSNKYCNRSGIMN